MAPLSRLVKSLSFHFLPVNHDSHLLLLLLFISSIVFFLHFFQHPVIKVIYFPTIFLSTFIFFVEPKKNSKWQFQKRFPRSPFCLIAVISAVWGASGESPSPCLIFHLIDYNEQLPHHRRKHTLTRARVGCYSAVIAVVNTPSGCEWINTVKDPVNDLFCLSGNVTVVQKHEWILTDERI